MTIDTTAGIPMSAELFASYMRSLVDRFFKILPIKESESEYGEDSLDTYIHSLQAELLGCKELVVIVNEDPSFMSLINILQYLIDNPDCSVRTVKREVFRAISICNKLKAKYAVVTKDGETA